MNLREKLQLYMCTDAAGKNALEIVENALKGGVQTVQLRMKNASTRQIVEAGRQIRKLTKEYDALFFVNDRVDVAMAVEADGVHVGQNDMHISDVKKIAGEMIFGVSANTVAEAIEAEENGADCIGAGAVFATPTKTDARVCGLDGLKNIVKSVSIPVVAIGGINKNNAADVLATRADGIVCISAIVAAADVRQAAFELNEIVKQERIKK